MDSNSNYFHSIIKWRRNRNKIGGIKIQGSRVRPILKGSNDCDIKLEGIVLPSIAEEDNRFLNSGSSKTKIESAIWNCENSQKNLILVSLKINGKH